MEMEKWTVEFADEYLNNIPKFSSEKHSAKDLRNMLLFLKAMPQEEKIIHIAGTNGKGSVCSFIDSILQKNGRHTARFTSPHLVRVTERFSFDGQEVNDELFIEAFMSIKASYDHFEKEGLGHPTYFEYLFLMFMWMVRRKKPEYVIMETGLGGRLDATNCIENPVLTIITSISLDHMEYLGDTVAKIAAEKAGILKKNVPIIYDDTDMTASEVIRSRAKELSCQMFSVNQESYANLVHEKGGMSLILKDLTFTDLSLSFRTLQSSEGKKMFVPFEAEYQAINACIAYQAALLLGIDEDMAISGVANAVWQGRMEKIDDGIYLDGAHNEGGIRAFADAAYKLGLYRREKSEKKVRILLLFAAVSDKNYESMLEMLMTKLKPEMLLLTHLSTSRALSIEKMETAAKKIAEDSEIECRIECVPDLQCAYQTLIKEKRPKDICFCVGSLYLIGELEGYMAKKQIFSTS